MKKIIYAIFFLKLYISRIIHRNKNIKNKNDIWILFRKWLKSANYNKDLVDKEKAKIMVSKHMVVPKTLIAWPDIKSGKELNLKNHNKVVIKHSTGCGLNKIVNANSINLNLLKKYHKKWKNKGNWYGITRTERQYINNKGHIFVEEFLKEANTTYRIWVFKNIFLYSVSNENKNIHYFYDNNFKPTENFKDGSKHYRKLSQKEIFLFKRVSKLAKDKFNFGFFYRFDFYIRNEKAVFSEFTLTPSGGDLFMGKKNTKKFINFFVNEYKKINNL